MEEPRTTPGSTPQHPRLLRPSLSPSLHKYAHGDIVAQVYLRCNHVRPRCNSVRPRCSLAPGHQDDRADAAHASAAGAARGVRGNAGGPATNPADIPGSGVTPDVPVEQPRLTQSMCWDAVGPGLVDLVAHGCPRSCVEVERARSPVATPLNHRRRKPGGTGYDPLILARYNPDE